MAASNGFPSQTTAGQGLFNGASSVGMIQGQADPDPATRFALRAGLVSQSETAPMWGGIGVEADIAPISASGPNGVLGQVLKRSTSLISLLGFTVFDQGYNMVNDPINTVPTAGSGQSINYYPLGCRARIAVACDPALVALRGGQINPQVSWDFQAQMLVPFVDTHTGSVITGASWASTGGGRIDFTVSTDLTADIGAGDDIEVANVINSGGASAEAFNGQWTVVSISATHIVVAAPAAGSIGTYVSGGNVLGGGGALPVMVLDVQPTGCITVDDTGGVYTYNYNGACAKIQLTGGTTA